MRGLVITAAAAALLFGGNQTAAALTLSPPQKAEPTSSTWQTSRGKKSRRSRAAAPQPIVSTSTQMVNEADARRNAETRCSAKVAYSINHDRKGRPKVNPACGDYTP